MGPTAQAGIFATREAIALLDELELEGELEAAEEAVEDAELELGLLLLLELESAILQISDVILST